ncbi:MAG TPA: UDP-N-acetylmuramoyl-L-alanine--D-glutamate ligase [Candidatus Moranbacteria bacterium]|nr:UDP-N-acetylmuramoyl-L-alanine--D-glutamate ligase [Candidatus Moranbacteria bacterium]HBI50564.1 UDP-N-acetylmuramoyl-L-alanine--D-glutamate ligase [Candidatus Moranbacteria bacterium]HBU11089.1 UDP-N-acetylmuramoyl-L-alanine--D-glutamate ligase [Candidatus Moranbacteria bacterium]HCO99489.1 UDP-N-acetylmuramoyl-L-alanine--D-glutamate ligase [Candidatus Moranbacteria bacterium]
MELSFFKNKKITVMGIGLHGGGVGTVKFLVAQGAKVIATDLRTKEQLSASLEKLKGLKNVEYVLGHHRMEDFSKVDMVIKNPAAQWSDKHIKFALENKVPVEMDSSLFFKICKNKIIGVTGTKGKTTTATLIYEILKTVGKNPIKIGIGQVSVLDKLLLLKKDSVVVFELSSWRLSALGRAKLSPHIAVFKNIMPDHLNYYGTMEKYFQDKKYIFTNQKPKDWLIMNNDDELLREATKEVPAQVVRFSYEPLKRSRAVFIEDDAIYLNNGIDVKKLVAIKDVLIPGRHNLSNVMAAIGAVYALGLSAIEIKKALPQLKGVAHRLEFVRELNGVKYYNDTAATIPDAAISGLNAFEKPIVLIAGGTDKNLDFAEFAKEILEKAKDVVLLKGNATDKLLEKIRKIADKEFLDNIEIVSSMEEATALAQKKAEQGDVVLLSPGAASFGLFANEFDRGDKFRDAVKKLK